MFPSELFPALKVIKSVFWLISKLVSELLLQFNSIISVKASIPVKSAIDKLPALI